MAVLPTTSLIYPCCRNRALCCIRIILPARRKAAGLIKNCAGAKQRVSITAAPLLWRRRGNLPLRYRAGVFPTCRIFTSLPTITNAARAGIRRWASVNGWGMRWPILISVSAGRKWWNRCPGSHRQQRYSGLCRATETATAVLAQYPQGKQRGTDKHHQTVNTGGDGHFDALQNAGGNQQRQRTVLQAHFQTDRARLRLPVQQRLAGKIAQRHGD